MKCKMDYKWIKLNDDDIFILDEKNIYVLDKKHNTYRFCNQSNSHKYLQLTINRTVYRVHRILGYAYLGLDINNKSQLIDHIDRDGKNNKINNLRIVTHTENNWNKKCKGFRMYYGKYRAIIVVNKKQINLGLYDTQEEASKKYEEAKQKYHIIKK
jgi:hypothetical protein